MPLILIKLAKLWISIWKLNLSKKISNKNKIDKVTKLLMFMMNYLLR